MPEAVETEEIHFLDCLMRKPVIVSHAIGGYENAGAIVAEAAMNEDFFFVILEERKELRDLLVGGRSPSADGNVDEAHAGGFGLLAFPFDFVWVLAAKVDDGGNAEFLELFEAFGAKLGAAKKGIVDFSGVGDAGKLEFFAERDGRDGGRRIVLRRCGNGNGGEKREEKQSA